RRWRYDAQSDVITIGSHLLTIPRISDFSVRVLEKLVRFFDHVLGGRSLHVVKPLIQGEPQRHFRRDRPIAFLAKMISSPHGEDLRCPMQPHDSSLFTPTEAAVLTRLPLKAVNN